MLDYDTLFAISLVQMLGRSSCPMCISEVTSSHNGQLILQELRDAGLVKIYIESSRCELERPLHKISLLDVIRAVHGRLEVDPNGQNGKQDVLTRIYGEAGIHLDKIRKFSQNLLATTSVYDVWLTITEPRKEELEKTIQQKAS
jgi:DNA-binding IscR family transcriptional regulator